MEPFIPFKPVLDFLMFVRGVVVADDMNFFTEWDATLDEVEKFNPLLMTVFTHTGSDHRAIHYIERCKESCLPVAFIVVSHRAAAPLLERQSGLGSIQCLHLTFLIA